MSGKQILTHLVIWLGVFSFWLLLTLDHHPTLTIAFITTAIMTACSAGAVYANALLLLPRFAALRWSGYLPALIALLAALTFVAVLLVELTYDSLWGPDPLRYGFWTNAALDGLGILLHVGAARLIYRPRRHARAVIEEEIGG